MQPGTYVARAVDIDLGYTSKGTPQYAVVFQKESKETITWYGYMTDASAERTLESLRYCGWRGMGPGAVTVDDLPEEVEIVVDDEEYNGEVYSRVKWVNQRSGRAALKDRMNDNQRRDFSAKFKNLAMKIKPVAPPPKQALPPVNSAPEQEIGDEIPF